MKMQNICTYSFNQNWDNFNQNQRFIFLKEKQLIYLSHTINLG